MTARLDARRAEPSERDAAPNGSKPMRLANRPMWMTVVAVTALGCGERGTPVEPPAVNAAAAVAELATATPLTAPPVVAIHDVLDRVIPALDSRGVADALHDAFDRVADALESADAKLPKRLADASALVSEVAAKAPTRWVPEIDALRLALIAAGEVDSKSR
jgi:hypothetical protein